LAVGFIDGDIDGLAVDLAVGFIDGDIDGLAVDLAVGIIDGDIDGLAVDLAVDNGAFAHCKVVIPKNGNGEVTSVAYREQQSALFCVV